MATKVNWTMNLRDWRKANGLTSPEWEAYADAVGKQKAASMLLWFVFGLMSMYFLLR